MTSIRTLRVPALAVTMVALAAAQAFAQDASSAFADRRAQAVRPAAGRTLTSPSAAPHASIVQGFLRSRGSGEAAVGALRQTDSRVAPNGLTHLRMEQEVGGLTVHGSYVKATLNARGELMHVIDKLAAVAGGTPAPAAVGELQALRAAMQRVHPDVQADFTGGARSGRTLEFDGGAFFHAGPRVTKVAVPRADGSLAEGYLVETWTRKTNQLHHTLVGGDGRVLSVERRTANDSYSVFIEDPGKGGQTTVSGPTPVSPPGTAPSPAGWLSAGKQTTIAITGNNVEGYLDAHANNQPDKGGTPVTTGNFLTAWNGAVAPTTPSNREVAVQNLFYLNNVVHDILYAKGFNEAAGNFQADNFARGGVGRDPVLAEAHDGEGIDNANFATPPDGHSGRMQMFLWSGPGATHEVQVNSPVAAKYVAAPATWGRVLDPTGLTGGVVVVDDGTGSDGCEPIAANLRDRIALVDRGTCNFTVKATNAQRAGATGLIVVNNEVGNAVFTMGGEAHLRIAALMIGNTDGAQLRALASPDVTLRKLAVQPQQVDGSLDADIVFHEFGHGLTWRMIGGMSGPLAGAIGEGAADGLAMLINGDDVVAEYSTGNPTGIRRARYSGYPLGYADVTGDEVHNDGEIYAAIVWRMMELFGARREVLFTHFVDGMNYTPSTPAYEDMRDGILQSIANTSASASDCGLVWQAFSQFGVGAGAQGTVTADGVDITASNVNPGNTCSLN